MFWAKGTRPSRLLLERKVYIYSDLCVLLSNGDSHFSDLRIWSPKQEVCVLAKNTSLVKRLVFWFSLSRVHKIGIIFSDFLTAYTTRSKVFKTLCLAKTDLEILSNSCWFGSLQLYDKFLEATWTLSQILVFVSILLNGFEALDRIVIVVLLNQSKSNQKCSLELLWILICL